MKGPFDLWDLNLQVENQCLSIFKYVVHHHEPQSPLDPLFPLSNCKHGPFDGTFAILLSADVHPLWLDTALISG